jgi:hypothetical protein
MEVARVTTQSEIDKLFSEDEAAPTPNDGPLGPEGLKAHVARKRAVKIKAERSVVPADAGTPDGELTPAAQAELDKLAAKNGDGVPDEIPGLTTSGEGNTLYAQRQAELKAARAAGKKPKGKPLTEKQKAAAAKAKEAEKAKAAKAKEAEKAKAEKAKAKEKTAKQKAAEATKKAQAKAQSAERAEKEKARQAAQAAKKAETRAKLEARRTPDLIGRENKATQAAFAEDYALAGPAPGAPRATGAISPPGGLPRCVGCGVT